MTWVPAAVSAPNVLALEPGVSQNIILLGLKTPDERSSY